jgi:hypothetical protein
MPLAIKGEQMEYIVAVSVALLAFLAGVAQISSL